MEIPLSFLQIEASYMMLFMLGITLMDYLIKQWKAYNNAIDINTPVSYVNCSTEYLSVPQISRWIYTESDQDSQTPIQRVRGLKYLKLEQRVRIMSGVRRRLDQHF